MKNIKLRMWSGKKYFYDTMEVLECLKQQTFFDDKIDSPFSYDHIGKHGAAFELFISLEDKNGAKLYEGDVFKIDESGSRYEVSYNLRDSAFLGVRTSKKTLPIGIGQWLDRVEIIGNIHENQELLK